MTTNAGNVGSSNNYGIRLRNVKMSRCERTRTDNGGYCATEKRIPPFSIHRPPPPYIILYLFRSIITAVRGHGVKFEISSVRAEHNITCSYVISPRYFPTVFYSLTPGSVSAFPVARHGPRAQAESSDRP